MLRRVRFGYLLVIVFTLLTVRCAVGDNVYARITGVVTDPQGAAVAGAKLTATNTQTGFARPAVSDSSGNYEFLDLPVGSYIVTATAPGFRKFETTAITLTVNQVYNLPIQLVVGAVTETVEVQAAVVQVETTNTQLQTLVNAQQVVDLPLLGRNWTNLEQMAPGVMAASDRFGTFSANGSQSNQSSYLINGMDSNDIPLNEPVIIPSPDAIAEFNLITNTINPEYGRNSGAIVNAVVKSGTNQFHGDVFEFYRDTFMNDRNFLQLTKPAYHENLFGGTFGGPIVKGKTFFFASYQGLKERAPEAGACGEGECGFTTVFTPAQRNGIFPSIATSTTLSPVSLTGSNGTVYPAGTPYSTIFGGSGGLVCGPTGTTACVVGQIPLADFNPISLKLMNTYVPLPNSGTSNYSFNPTVAGITHQGLGRIDHAIGAKDQLWGVIFFQHGLNDTESVPFTGSSLPGFSEVDVRESKQFIADWNHTFNATTLNEFRVGYTRFNFLSVEPQTPTLPSSFGFNINPELSSGAQLPAIALTGFFELGFSTNGPQPRKDQNYEITDNFSKLIGKHSLKFGFDGRRLNVWNPFSAVNNGFFSFNAVGPYSTGNPGADFLLGFPDYYEQTSGALIVARAWEGYTYVQDSWKFRPTLTLNFGTGWDVETPWVQSAYSGLGIGCFRPGEQSHIYTTAPVGLVFPGDPGCNTAGGATTKWSHFAPRFGFAWTPNFGRLGSNGKLSIRAGWGIYYNRTEEEGTLQSLSTPPVLLQYFQVGTSFANPFVTATGVPITAQPFPYTPPAPGTSVNFAPYIPFSISEIAPNYTVPYAMNYNLTVQRQLPAATVLTVAYVGSQGRHEQRAYEGNPVTEAGQAACVANTGAFAGCATDPYFREDYPVTEYGSTFGSLGTQYTDGTSSYNSLQASANKAFSHGLSFLASYTWSHSIDNGSGLEESGFNIRGIIPPGEVIQGTTAAALQLLNRGDSAFDARNRFVVSYNYMIPDLHQKVHALPSKIFKGWQLTGITTFQSGFPVELTDSGLTSRTCDVYTYYVCPDTPNQVGPLVILNPKTNNLQYFSTSSFAPATPGTFGNVRRNSFHGPNYRDTDFAIMKNTYLTKGEHPMYVQLRLEGYNIFNRTNFCQGTTAGAALVNPTGCIVGNVEASNFGQVTAAGAGRQAQLAAKFYF